ncbi:MAG: sigma-70 family RNA polymerase sigma factor [Blastocatellia bacterium]|nr:sigma-70 family RNA polymerase sigma factor [Blastocatellia bacterium]
MTRSESTTGGPQASLDPGGWVDAHADALFRFAMLRLRNASAAEEMVQETFLGALQSMDRFTGRATERTWLVGILKHKIVDHFRQLARDRAPVETTNDADLKLFDENRYWLHEDGPRDWGSDPSTEYERARFCETLQDCLSGLPPRMAAAFTMREIDDVDSGEVCKVLEVTSTNLWVILHRARAQLRLCLESNWLDSGGRAPKR